MKTPEELAANYGNSIANTHFVRCACKAAFIAGYQAAKESNSPENPDTCEHILDMSKMVDVSSSETLNNSSNNSNGWISVEVRLPKTDDFCLVNTEFDCIRIAEYGWESWRFNDAYSSSEHPKSYVTHWMPLPKPPEE